MPVADLWGAVHDPGAGPILEGADAAYEEADTTLMGTTHEPVRTGWPDTEPVNQATLVERIGWDAHMMVSDGRFVVERDAYERAVGLRYDLHDDWWIVVLNTATGYSIGRFRAMVPFGWLHDIDEADLGRLVQRAAMCPITTRRPGESNGNPGFPWPPTDEEP